MIKPKTNSFAFETRIDPSIFLYLNPAMSKAQFENTVAHEMHHIGLTSVAGEMGIIRQDFKTKDGIDKKAYSYFGVQGPWYTVGYRMAVTIERQFGRAVLVGCMTNLRKLLPTYNLAASELNRKGGSPLGLWSQELLDAVEGRR